MAALSPLATAALVGGGLFLVARSRANARRRADASSAPSGPTFALEVLYGPAEDPCLGDAYSRTAQPMLAEAYEGLSAEAQALYGTRPVYFINPDLLGPAFLAIASIRVNEPGVEPVVKVAQQLAPECDWLSPQDEWSDAMVAFRDSIERMVQVIDVDIGDTPELQRAHAWETYPLVRNGQSLMIKSGTVVAFELPPGDPSQFRISAQVQSGDPSSRMAHVGIVDNYPLSDGSGGYYRAPVILLRPDVPVAGGGAVRRTTFSLAAANPDGNFTSGSIEAYA